MIEQNFKHRGYLNVSIFFQSLGRSLIDIIRSALIVLFTVLCFIGLPATAAASIDNDRYDGNIFVLYAGNGSLVPVHETLAQAQGQERPTMLTFYVDDSSDCKQFAIVVSRLQEFYGRRASFLPISVDEINPSESFGPLDAGYYYDQQGVPQTVILDGEGTVRFNATGVVPYEAMDRVFREIFDLPVQVEKDFERRSYNEFNTELAR